MFKLIIEKTVYGDFETLKEYVGFIEDYEDYEVIRFQDHSDSYLPYIIIECTPSFWRMFKKQFDIQKLDKGYI